MLMSSSCTATPVAVHGSFGQFGPRERLVLSANGNLQRLISSYYNKPVSVHINYNRPIEGEVGKYDREVELAVAGTTFGVATSCVALGRPDLIDAVENKKMAIGQLFRHYKIRPAFNLLECSKDAASGAFQRTYMLQGDGVSCRICEKFVPNLFDLFDPWAEATDTDGLEIAELFKLPASPTVSFKGRPQFSKTGATSDRVQGQAVKPVVPEEPNEVNGDGDGRRRGGGLGDIVAANTTGIVLPGWFTPLQRVLLTANGNFERLVSSFYASSCTTELVSSSQSSTGDHSRVLRTHLDGQLVMAAQWTVRLIDPDWIAAAGSGVEVGGLFDHFHVLPTFQLQGCGSGSGSGRPGGGLADDSSELWRTYSLVSEGMVCEIHETIDSGLCTVEAGGGGGGRACPL